MRRSWSRYLELYRMHKWLMLWPVVTLPLAFGTGLMGNSPGANRLAAVGVQGVTLLLVFVLGWVVTALTPEAGADPERDTAPFRRPVAVLAAALLVILVADWESARFLPGWLSLAGVRHPLGPRVLLAVHNFTFDVVLPWAAAAALGLRFGLKGLRLRWIWVGCAVAFPFIAGNLVEWATKPAELGPDLVVFVSNFFVNGYSEEFLWRGLIQPRLIQLFRSPVPGIVAGAIGFGLWHYWANLKSTHSPLLALAACILTQAPMGFLFGYVAWRTRSLTAATVLHMWMDT